MWMSVFSVHPEHVDNEIPSWDPFWSGILTFLFPTDLALRRCHCTLGMGVGPYLAVESFLAKHFFSGHKEKDHFDLGAFSTIHFISENKRMI